MTLLNALSGWKYEISFNLMRSLSTYIIMKDVTTCVLTVLSCLAMFSKWPASPLIAGSIGSIGALSF